MAVASPANGTQAGGVNTIKINVSATDNAGVTQVSIYIDGVAVNTQTAPPYSYTWNVKKAGAGIHVITANAWDAAGNMGIPLPATVTK
ncbi:MAG: hypothetical protein C5B51_15145 [Terriglobia bacterium]|nr:MAG: hypothetical protein C5B51_15145 [Terriglobia bacterium]